MESLYRLFGAARDFISSIITVQLPPVSSTKPSPPILSINTALEVIEEADNFISVVPLSPFGIPSQPISHTTAPSEDLSPLSQVNEPYSSVPLSPETPGTSMPSTGSPISVGLSPVASSQTASCIATCNIALTATPAQAPKRDPSHFEPSKEDPIVPLAKSRLESSAVVCPLRGEQYGPGTLVCPMYLTDFSSPVFVGLVYLGERGTHPYVYEALFQMPGGPTFRRVEGNIFKAIETAPWPGASVLVKFPNRAVGNACYSYRRAELRTVMVDNSNLLFPF
ncbi:hypothetical protein EW145_g4077 [Phellinidium pouzarii]|uniref:Uncharacterized protein n=1 Tax=Phellinidium pouzarii TaxID=167371 RepID=A0A4S4L677_9AGAM|nr:hypothetical protein EW145_g4077 [Phellinidium pouzarii]